MRAGVGGEIGEAAMPSLPDCPAGRPLCGECSKAVRKLPN